jgi:hypothetical protein
MCHRTQSALPAYLDYVATKPEHFSCLLWTFPLNLARTWAKVRVSASGRAGMRLAVSETDCSAGGLS